MGEESLDVRSLMRSSQIGIDISDKVWNCATCKLCEESCPRRVEIVNVITGLRQLEFEERKAPSKMVGLLWDIYENGNPWGGKKSDRAKWAEGLNLKDAKEGADVLLYVGCDAAYNKNLHSSLRNLVEILRKANIDFGFLGNDERCCGEPVKNAGENAYLEDLVKNNIAQFEGTHAKTIVAFSPHCGNMFKTTYKNNGLKVEVKHYSQFLSDLIKEGKIHLNEDAKGKITIHDPCYLSRYGDGVEDLREMFNPISGLEVKEMENFGKNSLCCGGGGNRMFVDFEGKRLSDFRMDQVKETGADTVITACPICNMNLSDSGKTKGLKINVKELSEFLGGNLK